MSIEKVCERCQQLFYCYPSDINRKYCSLACRGNHRENRKPAANQTPVDFICKECRKPFIMRLSYLTAYRKKFERDPLYCSMKCSDAGRRKDTEAKNKFTCVNCGKEGTRRRNDSGRVYLAQKVCSKQCKNEWVSKIYREKHGLPKITKQKARHGYIKLRIPAMNGNPAQKDILEHRYVMEQQLNRKLYIEETVHHINGDRQDNRIENLELFSSRHGPGQRVVDKVDFAIEMLTLYPEFARTRSYELKPIHDPTAGLLSSL